MKILAQDGEHRLIELPAIGKYPAMWRSESAYRGMSVGTTYFTEAAARADYEAALVAKAQVQAQAMMPKGVRA